MFNADAAMYHTKHMGRNGYHFFQPSMNTLAQTHLQLMNLICGRPSTVMSYACFINFKFHAPCRVVLGFEAAVLRWQHPQGLLSPDLLSTGRKQG